MELKLMKKQKQQEMDLAVLVHFDPFPTQFNISFIFYASVLMNLSMDLYEFFSIKRNNRNS